MYRDVYTKLQTLLCTRPKYRHSIASELINNTRQQNKYFSGILGNEILEHKLKNM